MNLLQNKVAVITGSGRGIGAATARLFASHGAKVIVSDIDPDPAKETADTIIRAGGTALAVPADVTNSGGVAGDEVVELYLSHPGVPGAPVRALKGFQRIHLGKGEKKTVSFTLHPRDLGIVDEAGKHRVVPGQVDVWVGGGQPVSRKGLAAAAGVKTQFSITQAAVLPD